MHFQPLKFFSCFVIAYCNKLRFLIWPILTHRYLDSFVFIFNYPSAVKLTSGTKTSVLPPTYEHFIARKTEVYYKHCKISDWLIKGCVGTLTHWPRSFRFPSVDLLELFSLIFFLTGLTFRFVLRVVRLTRLTFYQLRLTTSLALVAGTIDYPHRHLLILSKPAHHQSQWAVKLVFFFLQK